MPRTAVKMPKGWIEGISDRHYSKWFGPIEARMCFNMDYKDELNNSFYAYLNVGTDTDFRVKCVELGIDWFDDAADAVAARHFDKLIRTEIRGWAASR